MNRKNIWVHITLAVIFVTFAAVIGRIERWRSSIRVANTNVQRQTDLKRPDGQLPMPESKANPKVLVRFKPGVTLERIRAIVGANHDVLRDEIESVNGLSFIDDLDGADPKAVAAQYAGMKDLVAYAEVDNVIKLDPMVQNSDTRVEYQDLLLREKDNQRFVPANPVPLVPKDLKRKLAQVPDDPQFADQWAHNNDGQEGGKAGADIGSLEAWHTTTGSDKVVVAVLDTGVDFTHPDLRENMWIRPANVPEYVDSELGKYNDLNGFDGTSNIGDPMDDNGHGTHCAGIIGAEGNNGEGIAGVNWHVKIMPLKFLGRGGSGTTEDAIEAINYAIDRKKHGVNLRIISASWGSTQYSKALEDTIRAAGDAGILFIAAAGNDGSDNDKWHHYPSDYELPNIVSVAATDRFDQLASFSNFGVKFVHVAAPGKDILSTWLNDDFREASGTSMATPEVSGVAALIVASHPNISMTELRAKLLSSVDKLDSLKGKVATGGRINAAKAVAN